jgi:hypothetical protein
MDKKKESAEDLMEKRPYAVAEEIEKYLDKLCKTASLCRGDAMRALEHAVESEELEFYINSEKIDVLRFHRVLLKILKYEIPGRGLRSMLDLPSKRIPDLMEKIDSLLTYLSSIPGVRAPEMPEIYGKIGIKKTVITRE